MMAGSSLATQLRGGTPALLLCALCWCLGETARAQEPARPQTISDAQLHSAIDALGALDYDIRTTASRTVRRTAGVQAVPALRRAVEEHADGYVRYRALVLLTGFNDAGTADVMRASLSSPNDRLRGVAYGFFEHHPDRLATTHLLAALEREHSEFVRPALIRALAVVSIDAVHEALVREVGRGEDFFRSVVIEALGDYKADYAFEALSGIAQREGPLADDAALALGKVGDARALDTLTGLQKTLPTAAQPSVAASLCLLGVNCETHERYLIQTLTAAAENRGFQEMLRGAASGLGALGTAGRTTAVDALFDFGIASRDPARAPVSLAAATVALRNTPLMLSWLVKRAQVGEAIGLLSEGFDMLQEDLEKERFFAQVRRAYWASPEGSAERELMRTLIGQLDF